MTGPAGPEGAREHVERGDALVKAGRLGEAAREYSRALELDPGSARARAGLKAALWGKPKVGEPNAGATMLRRLLDGKTTAEEVIRVTGGH